MDNYTTRNSTNTNLGNCYCGLCDKHMNVESKTGHINSKIHKRRERFAFTVKNYDFDILEINQVDNILKDVIKDCKDEYFHTFEFRCEHDIKLEYNTSGKVFYFKITDGFELFSFQSDRLHKQVGEYETGGYKKNEKTKLTMESNSGLS